PNLGPAVAVGNSGHYDPYGFLASTLGGVTVTFDGVPAPLFFVYGGQINLQVPFEVAGKTSTKMVVSYLGSPSTTIQVPVVAVQPAFFTADSSGKGEVSAANFPDYSINSAQNPIAAGGIVEIYGTGVGKVSYSVVTGQGAPAFPSGFTGNYTYTVGNSAPANALFGGWTPGFVGLAQWDLQIPAGTPSGPVSIKVTDTATGASSQAGTTIYVK
ncbi:MAG TPA: hypothetical protein VK789_11975, partial [Bryobacteraceae bacterium]|nr:hypothetical protein [Bryobacteraceae bacterium]